MLVFQLEQHPQNKHLVVMQASISFSGLLCFMFLSLQTIAQHKEVYVYESHSKVPLKGIVAFDHQRDSVVGMTDSSGRILMSSDVHKVQFIHSTISDRRVFAVSDCDTVFIINGNENLDEVTLTEHFPKPKKHLKQFLDRSNQAFRRGEAGFNSYSYSETFKIDEDSIYFQIPNASISNLNGAYSNAKTECLRKDTVSIHFSDELDHILDVFGDRRMVYHDLRTSIFFPAKLYALGIRNDNISRVVTNNGITFVLSDWNQKGWDGYRVISVDKSTGLISRYSMSQKVIRNDGAEIYDECVQDYDLIDGIYLLIHSTYSHIEKGAEGSQVVKKARLSFTNGESEKDSTYSYPCVHFNYQYFLESDNTEIQE